eukprot:TRINITY_DN5376_c0_g2_i3.p1 TRINITY_DN5376_c0_g2~~TRINITY_DN5376_c0_g2_i3.p1  ORF type:complete len:150 (-),score=35.63 TRINITY_DN5376_c0_g2_i3:102-551(-)
MGGEAVVSTQSTGRVKMEDQASFLSDPAFLEQLQLLAQNLNIPLHNDPHVTLNTIYNVVRSKLTPTALESATSGVEVGREDIKILSDRQQLPLGFNMHDPVLEKACTILRLQYINDLRSLQNKVNESISLMQTYTADPRTDTRLGRVGK